MGPALASGPNFNDTDQLPIVQGVGGNVGIGTSVPAAKLEVDGDIYIPAGMGNIGVGTWVPSALLDIGGGARTRANPQAGLAVKGEIEVDNRIYVDSQIYIGTPSVTWAGMSNGAAAGQAMFGGNVEIDGALYVDGFIYGNGSKLTGLTNGVSVNPAADAVPKSTGSLFVDSGIYSIGSNIGIGTSVPVARLNVKTPGATNFEYTTSLGNRYTSTHLVNERASSGNNQAAFSAFLEATVTPLDSYAGFLGGYYDSGGAAPSLGGVNMNVFGLNAINIFEATNARTITNLIAGRYQNVATAATNLAVGTAYGLYARSFNGDGALTNAIGLRIDDAGMTGAGTVGSDYGIYLANINSGTTVSYSIFSIGGKALFNQGSDAVSDFQVNGDNVNNLLMVDVSADRVGIGVVVPAVSFDVGGATVTRANPRGSLAVKGEIEVDNRIYVDSQIYIGTPSVTWVGMNNGAAAGQAMFGGNVEIDGALYVDGFIYGNGSKLTGVISGAAGANKNVQYNSSGSMAGSNSFVFDGTNVGIGNANPAGKLEVDGSLYITSATGNVGIGTWVPRAALVIGSDAALGNALGANNAYIQGRLEVDGSLYVPVGTAPLADVPGAIGVDTSDDQLVYYGAATRVIPYKQTRCVVIEKMNATDDNMSLGSIGDNYKLQSVWCHCKGTCTTPATIQLETSAAAPALIGSAATCAVDTSTPTAVDVSADADGTLSARVPFQFDTTNTPAPTTDTYTICYSFSTQRQ